MNMKWFFEQDPTHSVRSNAKTKEMKNTALRYERSVL